MSLPEVYRLAHTAECRLEMAAGKPDRDLRFVVGHLMHYESLRLRIVEIEHDISKSQRARAVQFQGAGELRKKPSTGQLGRRSPPPPPSHQPIPGLEDEDEDQLSDSEEDDEDLGLQRFPSGSARPPPLEPDMGDEDDDDEPESPTEPDQAEIEQAMKGESNEMFAGYYKKIKSCPCHGKTDSSEDFGRVWNLPPGKDDKEGVTRLVAEVTAQG
ncbi:hypothetical protein Q7P37_007390 [Cladosporium fusiforme]